MDYNAEKVKDAIHRRVLMYMSAHPGESFDGALAHVIKRMSQIEVEQYDKQEGTCVLYDPRTGQRGKGPCEPVGRGEPVRAGEEVASRVFKYQADHKAVSYADALTTVLKEDENLSRAYRVGPSNFYYGDEG